MHDNIDVEVHKESFSPTDSGIHVNSEYTDNFSGGFASNICYKILISFCLTLGV